MVTDSDYAYGEWALMKYRIIKSLRLMSKTNIILYANYTCIDMNMHPHREEHEK